MQALTTLPSPSKSESSPLTTTPGEIQNVPLRATGKATAIKIKICRTENRNSFTCHCPGPTSPLGNADTQHCPGGAALTNPTQTGTASVFWEGGKKREWDTAPEPETQHQTQEPAPSSTQTSSGHHKCSFPARIISNKAAAGQGGSEITGSI